MLHDTKLIGSKSKVGGTAKSSSELLLEKDASPEVHQPNIWLADLTTAVHMPAFEDDLINLKETKGSSCNQGKGKGCKIDIIGWETTGKSIALDMIKNSAWKMHSQFKFTGRITFQLII
jgi:hypothetical protein